MELEVGDVVLCTVERIEKTIVFVKIEGLGKRLEGSIIMSEVAPGRIRNIRDYVVPKKKIVCKILRISGDRIDLSLRRVTQKEKKEVMEQYKQVKSYINILKSIVGEKEADEKLKEIQKEERIYDFFEESKENPKKFEKLIGKKNAEKVLTILKTQKKKKAVLKKEFSLKTSDPQGLKLIKEILDVKDAEIKYISAGKYSIKTESEDIKEADNKLRKILDDISKKAKKHKMSFQVKER
jgi:translation initiation factor 2 subunit 1